MLQNTLHKPKMSILLFRQISSCSNSITIDNWNFSAFENTTYLVNLLKKKIFRYKTHKSSNAVQVKQGISCLIWMKVRLILP